MNTHNFEVVGADTDSILFKRKDSKFITPQERQVLLDDINSYMGEYIRWADDDYFKKAVIVKTKNYVLQDEKGKIKIKGSGLKGTMKEKALQRFMCEVIDLLLKDRKDHIFFLYLKYAREASDLKDISDWCSKKTVTKAILDPKRPNEQRPADALVGAEVSEGDKVYMFFRTETEMSLRENFTGEYHKDTMLGKLYDTLCIFETIIDVSVFPNFSLKRNKGLL